MIEEMIYFHPDVADILIDADLIRSDEECNNIIQNQIIELYIKVIQNNIDSSDS